MLNLSFTGSYSVTTNYLPGDYVIYGGNLYRALIQNTAIKPTNGTYWVLTSTGFSFKDIWSPNTTYSIGQTVIDGSNTSYLSLANTNIGNQPNTSTSYWRTFGNNYIRIVTNQPGDIQYEGNTAPVRLPIGNVGQILTVSNTGLPVWANTNLPTTNFSLTGNLTSNGVFTNVFTSNIVTTNTATIGYQTVNTSTIGIATINVAIVNTSTIGILTSNSVTSNSVTSNTYNYSNGESPGYTYALDDISSQFDGMATSFTLTYNGTPIAPNNPNQVQVEIGNVPVYPNTKSFDYVNLTTEIYTQQNGFTISGNTVTFATAPLQGMSFYGTYRTSADQMPPFYFYQVPFAPLNIMLS